jgi:hypothetical protein
VKTNALSLLLLLPLLLGCGCVAAKAPGFLYVRVGTTKAAKMDVKLGTNQIKLQGYTSDGSELAGAIAEGVAKGLKP